MSLQCFQSLPKIYQKWFTMGRIARTFWMCHLGTFWGHHSDLFWVLLTGNTVITLLGTLQRKFWILSLGDCEFSHGVPDWNILVTWPGTLQMCWPFPDPPPLQSLLPTSPLPSFSRSSPNPSSILPNLTLPAPSAKSLAILKTSASSRSVSPVNSKSKVALHLPPLQVDCSPPLLIPLLMLYGMQTQEYPLIWLLIVIGWGITSPVA